MSYSDRLNEFVDGAANVALHQEMSRLRMQRFDPAKGVKPKEPPPVLPWNDVWIDSVTFKTEPKGNRIRVFYPQKLSDQVQSFKRPTAFTKEFLALPRDIFAVGHVYDRDQPVFVHDHEREKTFPLVAGQLAGIEARGVREFVHRAELVTVTGLTLGLGAPAGAGAELAEGRAYLTELWEALQSLQAAWKFFRGPLTTAVSSMIPNIMAQAAEYGTKWEDWNFTSIPADAAVAAIGGEIAARLAKAVPVKISSVRDLATKKFLKNFAFQQEIFYIYSQIVAAIRNTYRKSDKENAAAAAVWEQGWSAGKSVGAQSYLASKPGGNRFKGGLKNPRWIIYDRIASVVVNFLIQWLNDATPKKKTAGASG